MADHSDVRGNAPGVLSRRLQKIDDDFVKRAVGMNRRSFFFLRELGCGMSAWAVVRTSKPQNFLALK
jgi:hypothetical protein